jgi:chromosomal replication initiator protein
MSELWNAVLDHLRENLSFNAYETWIKPLKARVEGQTLVIATPNKFFREWVKENYLAHIQDALRKIQRDCYQVELVVEKFEEQSTSDLHDQERIQQALQAFHPRYTFENFVVGNGNQLAHAAALAVAEKPGLRYNPLFIYGGVGLGKTHLLNAIGQHIIKERRVSDPLKVCYVSSEEFTNELINSIRYEKIDAFRNKYRTMDVLLIDDIQFLAGKERTQVEFFHTFNTLYQNKKQIVITSDRFPKDIANIEERLRSRFEWGLIVDIQPPDVETKVAILKKKAEIENIDLPDDVAFFIASKIDSSNIRVLEGCLIRLGAYASLTKKRIDIELAKEALKNIIKEDQPITMEKIINKVCSYFRIKPKELVSQRRMQKVVVPRQIAMYLAKKYTDAPLVEIGRSFGGRDHSTVIHAIKKIEGKLKNDVVFREMLEELEKMLKS